MSIFNKNILFQSEWNDGRVICEVIRSKGGSAPSPEKLRADPSHWEENLNQGLNAGRKLGVQPVLSAHDMADRNVEHLGVMAYAAHFQWIPDRPPIHDLIVVRLESTSGRIGEPVSPTIFIAFRNCTTVISEVNYSMK